MGYTHVCRKRCSTRTSLKPCRARVPQQCSPCPILSEFFFLSPRFWSLYRNAFKIPTLRSSHPVFPTATPFLFFSPGFQRLATAITRVACNTLKAVKYTYTMRPSIDLSKNYHISMNYTGRVCNKTIWPDLMTENIHDTHRRGTTNILIQFCVIAYWFSIGILGILQSSHKTDKAKERIILNYNIIMIYFDLICS